MKKESHFKEYALLAGCIAYFVLPFDIIPDALAGIGFSDDLTVLTIGFKNAYAIFSDSAKNSAVSKAAQIFGKNFDPETAAKVVSGAMTSKRKK